VSRIGLVTKQLFEQQKVTQVLGQMRSETNSVTLLALYTVHKTQLFYEQTSHGKICEYIKVYLNQSTYRGHEIIEIIGTRFLRAFVVAGGCDVLVLERLQTPSKQQVHQNLLNLL